MPGEAQLEDVVRALYGGLLGRTPSVEEAAGWVAALEGGTSLETVVRSFASSEERRHIEQNRHRARPEPWTGGPRLTIVDVGAQALEGEDDVFRPLLDGGGCRVIGFEPLEESHGARLDRDGGWTLLPYFVGDGSKRVFYETVWGPTSSLYEPDLDAMADFDGLVEICAVSQTRGRHGPPGRRDWRTRGLLEA